MKKILFVVVIISASVWWFKDPEISASGSGVNFGYIVKYTGGSNESDHIPMLVALHGNGDSAENFYLTALDKINTPARIILLKGPLSFGGGDAWPWKTNELQLYGQAVSEVTGLLANKYATKGKPVLMGFSGGGMMAYYQAAKHGDVYSFIFSVSGSLTKEHLGEGGSRVGAKVFGYHGKSDRVVPFSKGLQAIDLLKANNVKVKFKEFDGGHLGLFTTMKTEISSAIENALKKNEQQRMKQ